jgi:hypothetical protein
MAKRSQPRTAADIDPTQNVLDLVEAAVKRLDDLRNATNALADLRGSHQREISDIRAKHNDEIRRLESERRDRTREGDVIAINAVAATATATATALATQLQSIITPLIERVANLEKSSYMGAGKNEGISASWAILGSVISMALGGLLIAGILAIRVPSP